MVASLGNYTLLNLYAPAGSNNKGERALFYGREIFRLFRSKPLDFNTALKKLDVQKGVGFDLKL